MFEPAKPAKMISALALLFVVLNLSPLTTQGQRKTPDLELKLSTSTPRLCVGADLPLTLVIKNRSNRTVTFDANEAWSLFSYSYILDGTPQSGQLGQSCEGCERHFISLKPGESHETSYNYLFADGFFKTVGDYKLDATFLKVTSNELTFTLFDCNSN